MENTINNVKVASITLLLTVSPFIIVAYMLGQFSTQLGG